jgi:mono/diheme cytochrome c family protein
MTYIGIFERDRMATYEHSQKARSIQTGAILFEDNCSPCHGTDGTGVPGRGPALNTPEFFTTRLGEIGYNGSLESFVKLTVAGGRPAKTPLGEQFAQPMPTWSQAYGGPMRPDQVDNVVAFVMNWQEGAVSGAGATVSAGDLESDDPVVRGRALFNTKGCSACHTVQGVSSGVVGPELTNIYAEKGEDYIHESIVNPNAVIAEGFTANLMPQNFGQLLTEENIADIITFLSDASGQ